MSFKLHICTTRGGMGVIMEDIYQKKIKGIVKNLGDWFNDEHRLEEGKMTSKLYPYEKLFEPININKLEIKNRIVMGPMGNVGMADETGKPSRKMINYFIERAKGGAGLITSGMTPVWWSDDPSYSDSKYVGMFPRIDSNRAACSGWKDIAEGCHAYGARFFIQLSPGMGRVGSPECLLKKLKFPVSASVNPSWYIPSLPCRPLTDFECKKVIRHTGQIAVDARELGIDGVYLHGHSGYLIEQMTDPAFNRRKLGRYRNWQAFGIDMVKEIRKRCGMYFPIHYRIDLSLCLRETYSEEIEKDKILKKFKNGRTADMTIEYMKRLVLAGVDVFDVDLGGYENWWMPHPPNGMPPGVYIEIANMVKTYFTKNNIKSNAGFEVPIIAVGKLGFPDLAENALRQKKCDMIMLSRPLLADPYWPQKVFAGKVNEIATCIGDHEGCLGQFAKFGHIQCAVNPRTAFEDVYEKDLKMATEKKKIAVVGAGPAGVMFSCTAAKRGHEVTLFDKNSKAGGMLLLGGVPKIKYEINNYVNYLNNELLITGKNNKLKTAFNTEIDVELLKKDNYDAVIICSGTKQQKLKIEGVNMKNVVQGIDLLKDISIAKDAKKVVIAGGSDVGCEIAYLLSYELNKDVAILEMLPFFMKKSCTSNRGFMIHHLKEKGVKLLNCTRLIKIEEGRVEIERNIHKNVPNPYVSWSPVLPENISNPLAKKVKPMFERKYLDADLVVLCTGAKPNNDLYHQCVKSNVSKEIHLIGDSFEAGRVLEAVKSGYALGSSI